MRYEKSFIKLMTGAVGALAVLFVKPVEAQSAEVEYAAPVSDGIKYSLDDIEEVVLCDGSNPLHCAPKPE